MNKPLSAADRLIVAADFQAPDMLDEPRHNWTGRQVRRLAGQLKSTGACLKVNSILRAKGYSLIRDIRDLFDLRVFADLKLIDIPNTLMTDGALLNEVRPDIVTVMCHAGTNAMRQLKEMLPNTQVFGVTVPTSIKEGDPVLAGLGIETWLTTYADMALAAGIDGLIASPKELAFLRRHDRWALLSVATPGIRPTWAEVPGDDQNKDRVMTPADAIRAGADAIIVGRPIVGAEDKAAAVAMTVAEIESALEHA